MPKTLTIEIEPEDIPRSEDGSNLRIVPHYTEAGLFNEANFIVVTDGTRTAVYVPLEKWEPIQGD